MTDKGMRALGLFPARKNGKGRDQNELLVDGDLPSDLTAGMVLVNPRFDRGDHAEIADALLDSIEGCRERLAGVNGSLWRYEGELGTWAERGRDDLRRIVKRFGGAPKGEKGTLRITSGAAEGAIVFAYAEVARPGFFDDAVAGVAMGRRFIAIEGGEVVVKKHAPEHRARHRHAFDYDPEASTAELLELLESVFADAAEEDRAARIAFLQEHVGACLVGIAPTFQKCALLLGAGGNGKSTVEEALYRGALPDGTSASLAPQLWAERFQLARLVGATANVVDEIPDGEIMKTGVFKAALDGSPVHVEQKNRDPFEARLRCGHVFAANALPATKDLSDGFFRRFVVVRFDRRFDNTAGCDPHKAARIVARCRPGIVAFALEGAARLQRQGGYTLPPSSVETSNEWRRSSDSVALFIDERTRPSAPDELGEQSSHLYSTYKAWAVANGFAVVSVKTFAHRLEALGKAMIRRNDARRYPVVLRTSDSYQ
ncbi:MAG TPA: phage/plasmid primase, P4 family [Polyangiaceae bacterium]|jgi:P4 family phage/plasmid primase-like protien|nr:phage/plasmid primase, P4 family [Polyangiaceae bacterium]